MSTVFDHPARRGNRPGKLTLHLPPSAVEEIKRACEQIALALASVSPR